MRHIATDGAFKLTVYKSGAVAHFRMVGAKPAHGLRPPRGSISDMSSRSRIRCAFAFANSPRPWGAMVTLTYRTQPRSPKEDLKRFVRKFREKWGDGIQWGWIMEFQGRGVVHFHLFYERPWFRRQLSIHDDRVEMVMRHGQATALLRGALESWFIETWAGIVNDPSREFRRFQRGGIVELLRTPDAAARYVAKECSKRAQKQLPDGVECAGRWWWLAPCGKAKPVRTIEVRNWPYDRFYKLIFDVPQFLKREQGCPRWRTLQLITSHNICVAKAHRTLRLNSASGG